MAKIFTWPCEQAHEKIILHSINVQKNDVPHPLFHTSSKKVKICKEELKWDQSSGACKTPPVVKARKISVHFFLP